MFALDVRIERLLYWMFALNAGLQSAITFSPGTATLQNLVKLLKSLAEPYRA